MGHVGRQAIGHGLRYHSNRKKRNSFTPASRADDKRLPIRRNGPVCAARRPFFVLIAQRTIDREQPSGSQLEPLARSR